MAIAAALVAAALAGCSDQPQSPAEVAQGPTVISNAQSAAPAFSQLGASGFASCGVALDQSAWCWGLPYLGDGSVAGSLTPVRVTGGLAFRQISTDDSHTCGVATDFRAYCWGSNGHGGLGDGTVSDRRQPTLVAGGHRFYQVNAGDEFTCGVSYPDRAGYCWGRNGVGQLGDGTLIERHTPRRVLGNLTFGHVSAGANYACAVTTGDRAYCWGSDQFGQLGDNDGAQPHSRPVAVAGGLTFSGLEAGSAHTCAVTTAGVAYCWGFGGLGQLGNGKLINRFTPRAVKTTVPFRRVAPGSGFTCAETRLARSTAGATMGPVR
jgi:alpha-tubulin suppressor-like RCC1 family protein